MCLWLFKMFIEKYELDLCKINNVQKDQCNKWARDKYNNDPIYKLKENISNSLRQTLKNKNIGKNEQPTLDFLGFTKQDLQHHFSKYSNNPCERCGNIIISHHSKNYELDHIIPISLAKTEQEIIYLNQLDNLRLICKNCNQEKRDIVENPELLNKFYKNNL